MREMAPFKWLTTGGWIVLSGPANARSEIRARALSRALAGGAIAYISLSDDMGDALMDDMAELGATTGYLVDLQEQDNNEVYERLSTATMIALQAEGAADLLLQLLRRTAVHAMREVLSRGGLILFEGDAASVAGEHVFDQSGEVVSGLSFVKGALITADAASIAESGSLRAARLQLPQATFIGLASGSALVLGPDGHIETWGERQVTISLGDLARESSASERDWANRVG